MAHRYLNLFLFIALLLLFPLQVSSQPEPLDSAALANSVPFYRQFSFHTNVIDWAIAMPNVGVEFDFSGKPTSHYSLGVHVKYRPKMWADINPRIVLNVLQVRGEIRKYWRTFNAGKSLLRDSVSKPIIVDTILIVKDEKGDTIKKIKAQKIRMDKTKKKASSYISYLFRRYLSGAQKSGARDWRAYYWGLYGSAEKYTYNFDSHGRMGSGFSVGLTAGYTFPLYPMKNGASIDLDLGLSVGARMVRYDRFTYDEETHTYLFKDFHDWELVKRPVLEDAHVSLVYRFNSINNKVRGGEERFARRLEKHARHIAKRSRFAVDSLSSMQQSNEKKYEDLMERARQRGRKNKNKKDAIETIGLDYLEKGESMMSSDETVPKQSKTNKRAEKMKAKAEKETEKTKAKAEKEAAKAKAKAEKERAKTEKAKAKADKKDENQEKGGQE